MIGKFKRSIKMRLRCFAKVIAEQLIDVFSLDLLSLFYAKNGILKFQDEISGERWFISNVLRDLLSDLDAPVLLDIGANIGHYSIALAEAFPSCRCYSCEPNPATFAELVENTRLFESIKPINYGAGSKPAEAEIFIYKDSPGTAHASLYVDVFIDLHRQDNADIASMPCKIERIDSLVDAKIIPESFVHFIKIDTEGHELEGLRGSIATINGRGVRAIQFEFNEMNVVSRVFLKDFYELLGAGWDFFRLDSERLIELGSYDSANEIFKFQNIIAIRRVNVF